MLSEPETDATQPNPVDVPQFTAADMVAYARQHGLIILGLMCLIAGSLCLLAGTDALSGPPHALTRANLILVFSLLAVAALTAVVSCCVGRSQDKAVEAAYEQKKKLRQG